MEITDLKEEYSYAEKPGNHFDKFNYFNLNISKNYSFI